MRLPVILYDNPVFPVAFFNPAHDFSLNSVFFRRGYNIARNPGVTIKLHSMPHIKHLIHLFSADLPAFPDCLEKRRGFEQAVFYISYIPAEIPAFRLPSAGALGNPVNLRGIFPENLFYNRRVSARRREQSFADSQACPRQVIRDFIFAAVDQFAADCA
jgi:hypothetical protein